MKLLDQAAMSQLFEVTDELGLDREEIAVPLERSGLGQVEREAGGRWSITLPEDDLEPFLERLPSLLAEPGE